MPLTRSGDCHGFIIRNTFLDDEASVVVNKEHQQRKRAHSAPALMRSNVQLTTSGATLQQELLLLGRDVEEMRFTTNFVRMELQTLLLAGMDESTGTLSRSWRTLLFACASYYMIPVELFVYAVYGSLREWHPLLGTRFVKLLREDVGWEAMELIARAIRRHDANMGIFLYKRRHKTYYLIHPGASLSPFRQDACILRSRLTRDEIASILRSVTARRVIPINHCQKKQYFFLDWRLLDGTPMNA